MLARILLKTASLENVCRLFKDRMMKLLSMRVMDKLEQSKQTEKWTFPELLSEPQFWPVRVADHFSHLDEETVHADPRVLFVPGEKSVLNKTNHNLAREFVAFKQQTIRLVVEICKKFNVIKCGSIQQARLNFEHVSNTLAWLYRSTLKCTKYYFWVVNARIFCTSQIEY